MFWFLNNINKDSFNFIIKITNLKKHNIDDNIIYEFSDNVEFDNFNHNINCFVCIKENLIKYNCNNKNYYFQMEEELIENDNINMKYTKINENSFPHIIESDYDFFENVNFQIIEKKNLLIIKEEFNDTKRYYEIIY
jgi:hypothetical protein